MKYLAFLIFFSFSTKEIVAQKGATKSCIITAFSHSNLSSISQYFSKNIEVSINDEINGNTIKDANLILDFFLKKTIKSFSIQHEGVSKGNASKYCIGKFMREGNLYRIYVLMVEKGQQTKISRLVINKL